MYQIIIIVILISKSQTHVPVNSSQVVIVGGHADLPDDGTVFVVTTKRATERTTEPEKVTTVTAMKKALREDDYLADNEKDDVVFMPTERNIWRIRSEDRDVIHGDSVRVADLLDDKLNKNTEPPGDEGIYFVSGKNNDNTEKDNIESKRNNQDPHMDFVREKTGTERPKRKKPVLDCKNLNCNTTVESVCARKIENNYLKYRLFLNNCYFKKVNCAFENENKRYIKVDLSFCPIGRAHEERMRAQREGAIVQYIPVAVHRSEELHGKSEVVEKRGPPRRRAMSIDPKAGWCKHECPISCTSDYQPVCAVSSTGTKQVFLNHCKLDENSCRFHVMWQNRPLEECVGAKKAELQANKPFINWMQRVGVIDKKGRLATD